MTVSSTVSGGGGVTLRGRGVDHGLRYDLPRNQARLPREVGIGRRAQPFPIDLRLSAGLAQGSPDDRHRVPSCSPGGPVPAVAHLEDLYDALVAGLAEDDALEAAWSDDAADDDAGVASGEDEE